MLAKWNQVSVGDWMTSKFIKCVMILVYLGLLSVLKCVLYSSF